MLFGTEDTTPWYVALAVAVSGMLAAAVKWLSSQKAKKQREEKNAADMDSAAHHRRADSDGKKIAFLLAEYKTYAREEKRRCARILAASDKVVEQYAAVRENLAQCHAELVERDIALRAKEERIKALEIEVARLRRADDATGT